MAPSQSGDVPRGQQPQQQPQQQPSYTSGPTVEPREGHDTDRTTNAMASSRSEATQGIPLHIQQEIIGLKEQLTAATQRATASERYAEQCELRERNLKAQFNIALAEATTRITDEAERSHNVLMEAAIGSLQQSNDNLHDELTLAQAQLDSVELELAQLKASGCSGEAEYKNRIAALEAASRASRSDYSEKMQDMQKKVDLMEANAHAMADDANNARHSLGEARERVASMESWFPSRKRRSRTQREVDRHFEGTVGYCEHATASRCHPYS